MEAEVKGVEKSITSFKDLKIAIKEARDEQLAMSIKFGATSVEATNAGKKLADLKDKVEDLNDATKSLKGSGVEKLNASFSLLSEGIGTFNGDKIKTRSSLQHASVARTHAAKCSGWASEHDGGARAHFGSA